MNDAVVVFLAVSRSSGGCCRCVLLAATLFQKMSCGSGLAAKLKLLSFPL